VAPLAHVRPPCMQQVKVSGPGSLVQTPFRRYSNVQALESWAQAGVQPGVPSTQKADTGVLMIDVT
jgi:hypothetical protein